MNKDSSSYGSPDDRAAPRAQSNEGDWFVGSNGNLFRDQGGYRYCIARAMPNQPGYKIARDGITFAYAPSVADAKLIVRRETP
jgi:hypothetical protein